MPFLCRFILGTSLLGFAMLSSTSPVLAADDGALDTGAMNALNALGDGFLVWERSVEGDWQIWTRPLAAGGEEKRLVPVEEGRVHFCPKISPDGTLLAYLSYRAGSDAYGEKNAFLYVMDIASGRQTKFSSNASSYGEDRAVVWFDDEHLCYIEAGGLTMELDLKSGESKAIIKQKVKRHGWLINPTRTHATTGRPEFARYNAKTGLVDKGAKPGGCQPYFTTDGKWGYWMNGAGGPIEKIFLPTRTVSPILEKDDSRLPRDRGYLYFPMISSCMRLLTFAASPNDHDHFKADYDLFVSRIDPGTLDIIGKPVRYTNFRGCDRFPDVWRRSLPMGEHFVEGPTRLTLQAPEGKPMRWQVNGAAISEGRTLEHRFEAPGDHWVQASIRDRKFRGLVHVRKPVPPALVRVWRANETTLELRFDEAVTLRSAKAMAGSIPLSFGGLTDHDRTAILQVPANLKDLGEVIITGIRDTAAMPNEMPPTRADLSTVPWPVIRDGLVFAWENKHASQEEEQPDPQGKAFWSQEGGMDMRGGHYTLSGAGKTMMAALAKSGAFTLEALIKPRMAVQDKALRPVISLENGQGDCRLLLVQQSGHLFLRVATDVEGALSRPQPLCPMASGQTHHLVVGYENGRVLLWINGSPVAVKPEISGRLAVGTGTGLLRVGASLADEKTPWSGTVEQLCVYHRVLAPQEAAVLHGLAQQKVARRSGILPVRVHARLIETTSPPTLDEVKPYQEGLVKHLYEVLPAEDGGDSAGLPVGTRLMVSHWVWVNGERAVAPPAEKGRAYQFLVEPVEAHSEIKSLVRKSSIENDFNFPEYLDIAHW